MARRRGGAATMAGAVLGAQLLVAGAAGAQQSVVGGFEDASVPARGEARLRFGVIFEGASDQFGGVSGREGSTRVPLGARLSFDSLGAARFPTVFGVQSTLRDEVGVATGLTLGTATTDLRTLVSRVPFQLDFGVTRRLSRGVTIPIVRTNSSVNLRVNPGGTTGNLGFNPANSTPTSGDNAAAAQQDALVQQQFKRAADSLASLVKSCPAVADPTTPAGCAPIIANRAGASQLVSTARAVAGGLAKVYGAGTTDSQGALLVPIQGTDAQRAVEARIKALGTQFAAFSVNDLATPALPFAATARIAAAGLQRILTEEAFGLQADSVRGVALQGTGDVELAANAMWLDTFGPPNAAQRTGLRVRSTIGAGYRLATGSEDASFFLFDVPTGSGGRALLFRSATDIAVGRLWLTVVAHADSPFSRQLVVRVPFGAGEALAPAANELTADAKTGRRIDIEITPRWALSQSFAVAAQYARHSKQADQYTGTITGIDATGAAATVDASLLGVGTGGTAQLAGFGITYSTLSAFAHGRTWVPVEVSYLQATTFGGSGGVVPITRYHQLAVRVYAQMFGASARRPAGTPAPQSR